MSKNSYSLAEAHSKVKSMDKVIFYLVYVTTEFSEIYDQLCETLAFGQHGIFKKATKIRKISLSCRSGNGKYCSIYTVE